GGVGERADRTGDGDAGGAVVVHGEIVEVGKRRGAVDVNAVEKIAVGGDVGGIEAARTVEHVQAAIAALEREMLDGHVVGCVDIDQRVGLVAGDRGVQKSDVG